MAQDNSTQSNPQTTSQQSTHQDDSGYTIPKEILEKYSDLVVLIKETVSMNFEERQYWFSILPIMNEEQIQKLRQILLDEKTKLQKLDEQYAQELGALNEKHMLEWQEFQRRKKREQRLSEEKSSEKTEKSQEEELLKKLQDL